MAAANDDEDLPGHAEPDGDEADGVTDTDDGGAIVQMSGAADEETADEGEWYENLAEKLDSSDLNKLALEMIERIEFDKESRKSRDEKYAEGIKRTGLGDEAPGGAAFEGGSTAVHPMIAKAGIYYSSHTINELMPPGGPVKDWIPGEPTPDRVEKARRKTAHMNWQFRKQMPEFRSQLEKLLSQHCPAGSQYMRMVYDSRKKRPVPTFIPIDDVYIPEAAADFYSAERRTFIDRITQNEFESRIRAGYYVAIPIVAPSQAPDKSKAEKATDKVQGVDTAAQNEDGLRTVYVCEALADLDDPRDLKLAGEKRTSDPERVKESGEPKPYLIEIDVHSRAIVRIVRNWEESDDECQNMNWMVDFEFIPWRGAQSVGLIHLIGSLAGAATGSVRSLLDTALVQNVPTLIKLKGVNSPGQTITLNMCGVTELEGNVAGDQDIRKFIMPVPFNPPSNMLYQLLGFLTEQGEDIVRTTFENLSQDGTPNMPVGTTLALIEQGMKVLAAIHARLHNAMDRLIGILHRINRLYISNEEIMDDAGEMLAYRADYEGPVDVVPVSDPQVFSDIQRFAQLQIVQQRADLHPELYQARKVEEMILERTKIPNAKELLVPVQEIQELNAVNENVALALGRPVAAFPEQDHLAHIQVLLDFMSSPVLGMLPIIAPKFLPGALQHLAEHLVYWYLSHMVAVTSEAAGTDVGKLTQFQDPETKLEMDKTLAAASGRIIKQAAATFTSLPAVIQRAQQLLQQLSPPPPTDPAQAAIQTAQIASGDKKAALQQKAGEVQAAAQKDQAKTAAEGQQKMQQTAIQEQGENQRTAAELEAKERINQEDNATALEIAAAKVETGHSTNVSTGTALGRHENPGG